MTTPEPSPLTDAAITGVATINRTVLIIAKADGWAVCDLRSFFPKYTALRPWPAWPMEESDDD